MNAADLTSYEFGPFRLDPTRRRLFRDNEVILLPPKSLEVLMVLAANPGKLLDRRTLMEVVWRGTAVEDANLTVAISHARKALSQDGQTFDYIETIPRVGYRFLGEVRSVPQTGTPLIIEKHTISETVVEEETDVPLPSRLPITALIAAVILILGAAVGGALYLYRREQPILTTTVQPIRSIAILPPRPLTADEHLHSLSLGVADALIERLGRLHGVAVRPMSATIRYVDSGRDASEAGTALSVDAILEGTLQRADGRVRVRVTLIDARRGTQLWARTFDEADADLFKLQDRMSLEVANAIVPRLTQRQRASMTRRDTDSYEAYANYVKGDFYWNKRGGEVIKGIPYLQKAISLDPGFVRAYVRLASIHAVATSWSPEAETLIEKALHLDPEMAEAHATYGLIRMFHKWDWVAAERALDRAVELDPNSAVAHHWRGVYLSLHGRLDEAKAEMHRALTLDPQSVIITADIGQLHYFAGEHDQALHYCRRALALDPAFDIARNYVTAIYMVRGMREKAFSEFTSTAEGRRWETEPHMRAVFIGSPPRSGAVRGVESTMAAEGHPEDYFLWHMMSFSAMAGDKERVLDFLNRAYEERIFLLPFVNVDPLFDDVRNDPRFQHIVREMGLTSGR